MQMVQSISLAPVTACLCVLCNTKACPWAKMVSSNRQALKANWEECTAEPEERKEEKRIKAKRQRTPWNNHSVPHHPHTEFCQHKCSHPLALSEVLQALWSQTDTVQQVFGKHMCLVITAGSRQRWTPLHRPSRSHNVEKVNNSCSQMFNENARVTAWGEMLAWRLMLWL